MNDPAGAEDVPDGGAVRGIDPVGDQVVPGLHLRGREVEQQGVRLLARGDLARIDAEEGRAVARRPAEHLPGGEQGGVSVQLGEQGGEFHLGVQVEAVVGGGAVGAERDAAARFERELVGEAAAAELHVGAGAVGDGHAAPGQDVPFLPVNMHTVGGDDVRPQEAQLVQVAHRRRAVLPDAVFDFLARLAEVDVQQQAVVPGEVGAALEVLGADRIDGVRGQDELDAAPGGIFPVLDIVLEHFRLRFGVMVQHGDADGGAHAGGFGDGDGLFGVEVHIVEESRAGLRHLAGGEGGAAADVLRGEARLTPEDIRRGTALAAREMTQTGTTFFNDMYFDPEEAVAVAEATGMRAAIGITVLDHHPKSQAEVLKDYIKNWKDPTGGRIQLVLAPHSVYTVSAEHLKRCANFARHHGLLLHIHLSETRKEVEDCVRQHGTTPVRYLDKLGFLGPDVIAAHCVHVDREEWDILARRGVTVAHCPCSNMKLGSGRFPYELALESGCRITLGTDGAASNNSLDLHAEMKFAALLAKLNGDASLLPAREVFRWATRNGAAFFGIDAGEIAPGKQADALLLDLTAPQMQPRHDLISNWVYAADSSAVRHVLCAGRIVH